MKKIQDSSKGKVIYGCRFNRDDIESILELFIERKFEIKMTDEEYEYNNLEELIKKRGDKPIKFRIEGKAVDNFSNSVSIKFDKMTTWIFLSYGSDDSSKLIFEKILEICKSRKNLLMGPWIYPILPIIAGYDIGCFIDWVKKNNIYEGLKATGLLLVLLYFCYVIFRNPIILRKKHEGGFWKRNKDTILVAAITALITAIFTVILTKAFQ